MKKLKLAVMDGIGKELTRDELRNVFGGSIKYGGSGGLCCIGDDGQGHFSCTNSAEAAEKYSEQYQTQPTKGIYPSWSCNTYTAYTNCNAYISSCILTYDV